MLVLHGISEERERAQHGATSTLSVCTSGGSEKLKRCFAAFCVDSRGVPRLSSHPLCGLGESNDIGTFTARGLCKKDDLTRKHCHLNGVVCEFERRGRPRVNVGSMQRRLSVS